MTRFCHSSLPLLNKKYKIQRILYKGREVMKAEIIAVGTELLLGQVVNTNATFLSEQLADLGIEVYYQTVVEIISSV